jgi:hypothetical protein
LLSHHCVAYYALSLSAGIIATSCVCKVLISLLCWLNPNPGRALAAITPSLLYSMRSSRSHTAPRTSTYMCTFRHTHNLCISLLFSRLHTSSLSSFAYLDSDWIIPSSPPFQHCCCCCSRRSFFKWGSHSRVVIARCMWRLSLDEKKLIIFQ